MPKIQFDLPSSISRDVLETDLSYYFGRDAEIVRQKGNHYVIDVSGSQDVQPIFRKLRDDTATWRASDEYDRNLDYSQSRVHRERRQSATSRDSHYPMLRRESIVTSAVTPAMSMPSQRPGMPHRYSSTSGSVTESTLGSSYQSNHSYSQSGMYSSQSRRPSDAVFSERPSFRSRTESSSSISSNYGNDGYFGWKRQTGGDGYYGWPDSSPQTRKP